MLPLYDSHAHLGRVTQCDEHYAHAPVVIPGVEGEDTRVLRTRFPLARCATGIHPLWIGDYQNDLNRLQDLLRNGGFCAVGECGFDRRANVTWEVQEHYFSRQVAIARENDLPVLVHLVGGLDRFLRCHQTQPFRGVIHGCTLATIPQQLLKKSDISFGFSARLPQSSRANQHFATLPLERILLESDADETAPATVTRLESAFQRLAALRKETIEEVSQIIYENTRRLFG